MIQKVLLCYPIIDTFKMAKIFWTLPFIATDAFPNSISTRLYCMYYYVLYFSIMVAFI